MSGLNTFEPAEPPYTGSAPLGPPAPSAPGGTCAVAAAGGCGACGAASGAACCAVGSVALSFASSAFKRSPYCCCSVSSSFRNCSISCRSACASCVCAQRGAGAISTAPATTQTRANRRPRMITPVRPAHASRDGDRRLGAANRPASAETSHTGEGERHERS